MLQLRKTILKRFLLCAGVVLPLDATLAHDGKVSITIENGERCFQSNGLPDHATGTFPNRGNPNAISAHNINVCVVSNPQMNAQPRQHRGSIGIGINGVQFRPGTADFYDANSSRGFSSNPSSGWSMEGLNPKNLLGMDSNNAHVGPDGLYHYHGVANALVKSAGKGPIGYAADGFEIHYAGSKQRSSYRLKSGTRQSGPGGKYDGTFVEDFAYVAGSGTLDACNGGMQNGKFVYFATETYPFLPRCLWGDVSQDFHAPDRRNMARAEQSGLKGLLDHGLRNDTSSRRNPQQQGGQRQASRNRPPPQALDACSGKQNASSCAFTDPRGNNQISGSCRRTPSGVSACVPEGRRARP